MAHRQYEINNINDFYKKFKEVKNENSNKIDLKNCNINFEKARFSFERLCNELSLNSQKTYHIVFTMCKFRNFYFAEQDFPNISFSFIECSTEKVFILSSSIDGLIFKNQHSNVRNQHSFITLVSSTITTIQLHNTFNTESVITINKVSTDKLFIQDFNVKRINLDLEFIKILYINTITAQGMTINSNLLSTNNIVINDARKVDFLLIKDCNLENTEIKKLNLSNLHTIQNRMNGVTLNNFTIEKKFDRLNVVPIIFLSLLFFVYFSKTFILLTIYTGVLYFFSKHYCVNTKKLDNKEIADNYREYKNIFKEQENLYWYHEMLYSEQLHILKSKSWYKNLFNLKYYNYLINGFGRRWKRTLLIISCIVFFSTFLLDKSKNYTLSKNTIPNFVQTLYESSNYFDSIQLNLIYILSKLDILKLQSASWFSVSNTYSFFSSNTLTFILVFLLGAFVLAFKRRLDK